MPSVAAPVFKDFMEEALEGRPTVPFRIPPGIRLVRVNAATGKPASNRDRNFILEAYKIGTEPDASTQSTYIGGGTEQTGERQGEAPAPTVRGLY